MLSESELVLFSKGCEVVPSYWWLGTEVPVDVFRGLYEPTPTSRSHSGPGQPTLVRRLWKHLSQEVVVQGPPCSATRCSDRGCYPLGAHQTSFPVQTAYWLVVRLAFVNLLLDTSMMYFRFLESGTRRCEKTSTGEFANKCASFRQTVSKSAGHICQSL